MSSNTPEVVAELKATQDYLADLTERVESFDFEDSVAVQDEARRVKRKADELMSMIDSELLRQLEAGARDIGRRTFKRTKKYVERDDHGKLESLAIRQAMEAATDAETGVTNAHEAARVAAATMAKLYLNPSAKAKVSVAERLGLERDTFRSREFKEWQISVIEEDEE